MILISILFVISFTLNVILGFKLKKSIANVEELEVKVKVLSDYADDTVKAKTAKKAPLQAVAEWAKSETQNVASEVTTDAPKKARKPRRKKKPTTNKD